MSSAICFNLGQSKILSSGNALPQFLAPLAEGQRATVMALCASVRACVRPQTFP